MDHQKQTNDTASLYGLNDAEPQAGKRADINVIDYNALTLHGPKMAHDLPAGGRRLYKKQLDTTTQSSQEQ